MQNESVTNSTIQASEVKGAPGNKLNKSKAGNTAKNEQKAKYYKPKYQKSKSVKENSPKSAMVAPKKIKLLFTIVNRQKTEFFVDVLQNFEINMQLVLSAQGTANDHVMSLLGLTDSNKSVIISVIRQDKIKEALATLEDKFNTVKGGKGIAYTVPIKSAIGVAIYRFLSNTSGGGLING